MKSSELLLGFYQWWLKSDSITTSSGLCTNLAIYTNHKQTPDHEYRRVESEMKDQFMQAGLDLSFPFNEDQEDYFMESHLSSCPYNPHRVQWVQDRIKDMEAV